MKIRQWRHALYLVAALAMLVYALPRLELGGGWSAESVFGLAWTVLALLAAGANLWMLIGQSEEKRRELERIRRAKWRMWQRGIERAGAVRRGRTES